jgi:hypothetical protein
MRSYLIVSAIVFCVVALANLTRLALGVPIEIGSFRVPTAASWGPVLLAGTLAVWGFVATARRSFPRP